jgi:hypothetical protein
MKAKLLAVASLLVLASLPANAAITTYIGADDDVSSLSQMTNSSAAAASFLAAVSSVTTVDFESALPSGLTITGGSITNNSGCGALCGFNTTAGGQYFYSDYAATVTFTFADPISAFGMYVTGLQTNLVGQEFVTFSDGSTQTIDTPTSIEGGGAFIGFTDFGKSIVSISYNASNDIVAFDDLHFTMGSAAPEASTWVMLTAGFGGLGLLAVRGRRKAVAA